MKKIFTLILFSMISFNAIHAWSLSDDGTTLYLDEYDMSYSDSHPWYSERNKIKKAVIRDGVTNICPGAFLRFSNLTSVTIGNSVTSIGEGAFMGCSGLTSITIPNSVTSIGDNAFSNCSGLKSITIPNSVTSIGHGAFYETKWYNSQPDGLVYADNFLYTYKGTMPANTEIVIKDGTKGIADYAFYNCTGLTSITIPNSVTSIGNCTFYRCLGLTSIDIPNSVTSIGEYAFYNCTGLTSITSSNSVTSIRLYAFNGTEWLNNQPDGLIYIGKCLYKYKGSMPNNTKIEIKEGTIGIAEGAFWGCSGLTSITIPNSVTRIGNYAFRDCSGLTSITIPNSVTSIGEQTFVRCSNLTSFTIPNSVTSIGRDAFYGCFGLTSIDIPNSVTSIGQYAFYGCSGLTSITIPNSVTSIRDYTFDGCSGLTSITIPNSVTRIGNYAFRDCSGLTSITCEPIFPPGCYYDSFENVDKSIPVYVPSVPDWSIEEYQGFGGFTNVQAIVTTYTLADGELYNIASQYVGYDISYTRTFNNTAWQALYIPFSMSYRDWKDNFEVAYINNLRQLDTDDDGVVDKTIMDIVKIKEGSLIPNNPYLIKAKSVGEKTISVSNATLYEAKENSIDCRTTIAEYTFTGTYNAISASTLIANNYYTMGGGALIMTDGSSGLKPYRWYMKIEPRSPMYNVSNAAKTISINVVGEEETTGVKELQMTNDKLPVYDMNGRKVNENNLKSGIYVKNGKKFVVK